MLLAVIATPEVPGTLQLIAGHAREIEAAIILIVAAVLAALWLNFVSAQDEKFQRDRLNNLRSYEAAEHIARELARFE